MAVDMQHRRRDAETIDHDASFGRPHHAPPASARACTAFIGRPTPQLDLNGEETASRTQHYADLAGHGGARTSETVAGQPWSGVFRPTQRTPSAAFSVMSADRPHAQKPGVIR